MADKTKPINIRMDELTMQLLLALQDKTDRNRSDLIRSAIFNYAKYEFGDEEFPKVLLHASEVKELLK